ncbi:C40 family peptidase [Paenibacillus sediminis]|uniref:Cell wall-associated NlpC family hydrolase n=1 Tax=Paenibacillus sediminis TaxID=664909 RepID=A0ABS4H0C8_9BACL|nr:C40 family peptidase [Paenibacillus sediminis]MBP1935993.1 cell wall-associated NlpC family hydrolase [Paenibacillus sediminis]
MSKRIHFITISAITSLVVMTSACSVSHPFGTKQHSKAEQIQTKSMNVQEVLIPLMTKGTVSYVSADQLAKALHYHSKWKEDIHTFQMGEVDPVYSFTANSLHARKAGRSIRLSEKPMLINGKMYLPVTAVSDVFKNEIQMHVKGNKLALIANRSKAMTIEQIDKRDGHIQIRVQGGETFFKDDPADPYNNTVSLKSRAIELTKANTSANLTMEEPAKQVDMNALIETAKQYLGVPYEFGAEDYDRSKAFDCSSFTQYVYGKYGVSLRRTARDQAEQGIEVDRQSLRKGDLLFFSVPGRFETNDIVGHVAIYMGDGQMIHTYSKDKGVCISELNQGHWADNYMWARRVANY